MAVIALAVTFFSMPARFGSPYFCPAGIRQSADPKNHRFARKYRPSGGYCRDVIFELAVGGIGFLAGHTANRIRKAGCGLPPCPIAHLQPTGRTATPGAALGAS